VTNPDLRASAQNRPENGGK